MPRPLRRRDPSPAAPHPSLRARRPDRAPARRREKLSSAGRNALPSSSSGVAASSASPSWSRARALDGRRSTRVQRVVQGSRVIADDQTDLGSCPDQCGFARVHARGAVEHIQSFLGPSLVAQDPGLDGGAPGIRSAEGPRLLEPIERSVETAHGPVELRLRRQHTGLRRRLFDRAVDESRGPVPVAGLHRHPSRGRRGGRRRPGPARSARQSSSQASLNRSLPAKSSATCRRAVTASPTCPRRVDASARACRRPACGPVAASTVRGAAARRARTARPSSAPSQCRRRHWPTGRQRAQRRTDLHCGSTHASRLPRRRAGGTPPRARSTRRPRCS